LAVTQLSRQRQQHGKALLTADDAADMLQSFLKETHVPDLAQADRMHALMLLSEATKVKA
jgi:hypothetical protein